MYTITNISSDILSLILERLPECDVEALAAASPSCFWAVVCGLDGKVTISNRGNIARLAHVMRKRQEVSERLIWEPALTPGSYVSLQTTQAPLGR